MSVISSDRNDMGKEKKSQWGKNAVLLMVVLVSTFAVSAFYNLGSSNTFTSETRRIRETVNTFEQNVKNPKKNPPSAKEEKVKNEELKFESESEKIKSKPENKNKQVKEEKVEAIKQDTGSNQKADAKIDKKSVNVPRNKEKKEDTLKPINVIITFTKAGYNIRLQQKFRLTVSSLLKHAKPFIKLHILGEPESQALGTEIVEEESKKVNNNRLQVNYPFKFMCM